MVQTVQLEDGSVQTFPDEATPEQITAALKTLPPAPSLLQKGVNEVGSLARNALQSGVDFRLGLVQGVANLKPGLTNLGIKAKNLFSDTQTPEQPAFNFAPNDLSADAGTMASYLMPGTDIEQGVIKGAGILGGLKAGAKTAATGALKGAVYNPNSQGMGAVMGSAGNLLGMASGAVSPYLSTAARAGAGGLIGYGLHPTLGGAITGATMGAVLPSALSEMGMTKEPVASDFLKDIPQDQIQARVDANKRLGTRADIGEVSNNPVVSARIGAVANTPEGAQGMTQAALQKIQEQKKAIDNLKNSISPTSRVANADVRTAAQQAIANMKQIRQDTVEPLYTDAHSQGIPLPKVEALENSDKTIKNAIASAMSDPAYSVELDGFDKNSVKVLDYAKRTIDGQIEQAKNFGDNDKVRVLNDSKNRLLNAIDGFSPEYKNARQVFNQLSPPIDDMESSQVGRVANVSDTNLKNVSKMIFDPNQTDIGVLRNVKKQVQQQDPAAWDNIVRNEVDRLTKGQPAAADFYKNVLSNDNIYQQMRAAVEHNPDALQKLDDMKTGWQFMTKPDVGKNNRFLASKNLDKARSSTADFINSMRALLAGKRIQQKVNFLNDPNWINQYNQVANYQFASQRKKALANLISQGIAKSAATSIPALYTASQQQSPTLSGLAQLPQNGATL